MKLTSGKLRYLLTVFELEKNSERVRSIDVAVRLGISRASVCKMLSMMCREGLLEQKADKSLRLTEQGNQLTERCRQQYCCLFSGFCQIGLGEYDAQECSMALLSQLSEQTLKNICSVLPNTCEKTI